MAEKFKTIYDPAPIQAYFIQEIKEPLLEGTQVLFDPNASKIQKLRAALKLYRAFQAIAYLPPPTIENTWHPNGHNLIRIRDWLNKCLGFSSDRMNFINRGINLAVMLINFDPPWRFVMDKTKDEGLKMDWKPAGYNDEWVDTYNWWHEEPLE